MKIGILLCGDIPESLIVDFGSYATCLQEQLNIGHHRETTIYNVYEQYDLPKNIDMCDAYIIGGSPAGVNDGLDWLNSLSIFIRKAFHAKKKLVGICFGHQMINYALGGEIRKSEKGWGLGIYDVMLHRELGDMKKGDTLSLIAMHQDQVINPAENFEVIASNDFCPNYITAYKDQVLTVQGHPEFSYQFFAAMLRNRHNIFTHENIKIALSRQEHHGSSFNAIINRFIFDE